MRFNTDSMTKRKRWQAGRVNVLAIGGIVCLALIVFVLFAGRESTATVGARFMTALAKGDVDTLTQMSFMGDETPDQVRKQWDYTVHGVGQYYRFRWHITGTSQANDNTAAVLLQVARNADTPSAYDENYQLPLVKVNGGWKVDVRNISRDMFPALPR